MKLHLKLFLCLMISLGQAAGEDPLLHEDETPGSQQEMETLIAPEILYNGKVLADDKLTISANITDIMIRQIFKTTEAQTVYVDKKCCNLSTTPNCLINPGGHCVPTNETCYGEEFFGSRFCVISNLKSCKCCVPRECEKATLDSCRLMNGTCKASHQDCDDGDSSVIGKDFCKYKNCKCCFPKYTSPCPCGQDLEGGCSGYLGKVRNPQSYHGRCMKTCEKETLPLLNNTCSQTGGADCECCASTRCPNTTCVGVHDEKQYEGLCRFGGCLSMEIKTQRCLNSNCDCCINVTDPFGCNTANNQEYDCSQTETEIIGSNTVPSTLSVAFTSGMTLGIRMFPDPGYHDVIVYAEAAGYPDGVFKIWLDERFPSWKDDYHWIIHRWTHNFTSASSWHGRWIQCIPKNEWLLLTITDQNNGYVEFKLHDYYTYRMSVTLPKKGITIRVDDGNTNLSSEISLECLLTN